MRAWLSTLLTTLIIATRVVHAQDDVVDGIKAAALADGIDLTVLEFADEVLAEIAEQYAVADASELAKRDPIRRQATATETKIDVHAHIVPDWYRNAVPQTGGNPTPAWTPQTQAAFMSNFSISHSILSFSTPGANLYPNNRIRTAAYARLINEYLVAFSRSDPSKYSFYAVVPLPYVQESINEAQYAVKILGAVGLGVQSNHEGVYLGHTSLTPFFRAVNALGGRQILYIHPASPQMKLGGKLVEANPTQYPSGRMELYFETARTLMDLTLTQTIHNFTNINYIIPHVGGAWPSCIDRVLRSVPALYEPSLNIYRTRFWWDSAGPTYFNQVDGLLAYDIPKSQLLYGSDFPYAPATLQLPSLQAILGTQVLTPAEKTLLFRTNARNLFGNRVGTA